MKAMILAAGLGTRLRPWTLSHPKALVPVKGVPMLERVVNRLKGFGFNECVVNIHHFGEQIIDFLYQKDLGINFTISDERSELLDTGGGLLAASRILMKENDSPFLVHNTDILSNADLGTFMKWHNESRNDVSMLVSNRESSRKLLFDKDGVLRGWHNLTTNEYRPQNPDKPEGLDEMAFSGIYIIGKRGVEALEDFAKKLDKAIFPIMDFFLSFPKGVRIGGYEVKDLKILDIGKPAALQQAENLL